jgi:DMSO/TMAO reductase YedYZ molybdopterin-dependent catalytic subunit
VSRASVTRRDLLKGGGAAVAGFTVLTVAGPAGAFPARGSVGVAADAVGPSDETVSDAGEHAASPADRSLHGAGDVVIPWLDQPPPNPEPAVVGHPLVWEELDSWITPNDEFFTVKHYNEPSIAAATYQLDVVGLVDRPVSYSLADLQARTRRGVVFTLECSGNTGIPFFIGGVGNAYWVGTPLAALLREAGVHEDATEVIFWGADAGEVTIRDNSGVIDGGSGTTTPDAAGGLDLTVTEQFARSMSVADAMNPNNLLCYEMNHEPLPPEHGHPVRLIAPGWYGVANVKWLTRIEVVDQRYAGRFMARDYVTIREEPHDGQTVWTFSTVGHDRLKSVPAQVLRREDRYTVLGAAWGAPVSKVEVSIDGGPWQEADRRVPRDVGHAPRFAWSFWTYDWGTPAAGEHTVASRAYDVDGNLQPEPDDPFIAAKRTYWESNAQVTRRVRIG